MTDEPSPIDGLIHTSVWSKLRDLEARIIVIEKLKINKSIILEICENYCPTCEKNESCIGALEYGAHTSCCPYHHIICNYFSDEINECIYPDSHYDNFECPYTGYSNYGNEHCTNCKFYREYTIVSSTDNTCLENHFNLVKSINEYCRYWKSD